MVWFTFYPFLPSIHEALCTGDCIHLRQHVIPLHFAMMKRHAMPGPGEELKALKGWERKRCPKGPIARRLPLYSLLSGRRILSPIYIWPHLGFGDGGRVSGIVNCEIWRRSEAFAPHSLKRVGQKYTHQLIHCHESLSSFCQLSHHCACLPRCWRRGGQLSWLGRPRTRTPLRDDQRSVDDWR